MSIEFGEVKDRAEWDHLVATWRSGTAFHRSAWLDVAEKFSDQPCVRLLGREDGEPIVAMPFFVSRTGPFKALLSPPPRLGIEYLGPLLRGDVEESSKGETLRLEVLRALLEWIRARFGPALLYFRTCPSLTDPRGFQWNGCTVGVLYTYVIALPEKIDDLLPTFHRRVRTYLRSTAGAVDVRPGGRDLCVQVQGFVADRFRDQGKEFGPPQGYFSALYDALGPATFQPIGAHTEAGLGAGAIVTFHGDRAMFWQHATSPSSSRLPLTEHLVWSGIKIAAERGATKFELVGANTPRLVSFKTKFAPALEQFFEVSKATATGKIAQAIYRRLRG